MKKIIENNEIYYNIFKGMIKSYQNNDINNELLQNINELKYNNYMNDINEDNLLDIYHKMNNKIQILGIISLNAIILCLLCSFVHKEQIFNLQSSQYSE